MKMFRYLRYQGWLAALLFIGFVLLGCSRGPGQKWVKDQVRNKFDTYWVWGDQHPREGIDYTFGKYEIAKGGKEGRIHITIHTKLFYSKDNMHSSMPAPRWFPGDETIEFSQDEYGEWHFDREI